jgi:hypothetical protein
VAHLIEDIKVAETILGALEFLLNHTAQISGPGAHSAEALNHIGALNKVRSDLAGALAPAPAKETQAIADKYGIDLSQLPELPPAPEPDANEATVLNEAAGAGLAPAPVNVAGEPSGGFNHLGVEAVQAKQAPAKARARWLQLFWR